MLSASITKSTPHAIRYAMPRRRVQISGEEVTGSSLEATVKLKRQGRSERGYGHFVGGIMIRSPCAPRIALQRWPFSLVRYLEDTHCNLGHLCHTGRRRISLRWRPQIPT